MSKDAQASFPEGFSGPCDVQKSPDMAGIHNTQCKAES